MYYCNPYASFEKTSNENINGLVRRLYKKGTNFNEISDQEINELQEKINNMSCKMHCIIFLKNPVALEITFRQFFHMIKF
ncbi:MAG: IS30 family transposase [Mycoplasmataceae bacterium]|nr:IS30 family transposase [Mycoplasmataceae bacterium]